jgi:hypothetical protein
MIASINKALLLACLVYAISISDIDVYAGEGTEVGTLDAAFRTFYFNRDKKQNNPDSVALSQALMLRYHSPYADNVVNFNASVFGNLELQAETGEGGTGLLHDEDDGDQSSYSKLAEIYARFNLPNTSSFDIGRLQIDTPLLNDSDNRATPSTTQLAILDIDTTGPDFYVLASDRGSAKTEPDFGKYTDSNGDNYNVYVAGIDHEFNNSLYLHGAIGQAESVMQQVFINARYPLHINDNYSLLFDAYQYFGEADGEGLLDGVGPDYSSDITNIVAQVSRANARFSLSYQKVQGDEYRFSWDGGVHDDNDLKTWHVVQRMKFIRAEEASWQVRFDYDFKNFIEGLSAFVRYTSGDEIRRADGTEGSEWENNIDITYAPPGIENLSFRWRNSTVRSSETFDSNENRIIVNYTVKAF